MVQNGHFDHFGQNDLIPNRMFSIREINNVISGGNILGAGVEVHFGLEECLKHFETLTILIMPIPVLMASVLI